MSHGQTARKRNVAVDGAGKSQKRALAQQPVDQDEEDSDAMQCDRRSCMMGYCGGCLTGALMLPIYIGLSRAFTVPQLF